MKESMTPHERTKWILQLLVSVVVPAGVAALTTECALNSEIREGQAVFNNIGYRYFGAVYAAYVPGDGGTREFTADPQAQSAYRAVLSDIAADIRWLRTNPLYGRLQAQDEEAAFALAQNALAREANGVPRSGVDAVTLALFCSIYEPGKERGLMWAQGRRSSARAPEDVAGTFGGDLVTFASRLCSSAVLSAEEGRSPAGERSVD